MSADAKVWPLEDGSGQWGAVHDGPCKCGKHEYDLLSATLLEVEECMGTEMKWEIFQFGNGPGLRGYRV